MNKINLDFFANQTIQIDLSNFVINLMTAIILSFLVQQTYNKTAKTLSNIQNFLKKVLIQLSMHWI